MSEIESLNMLTEAVEVEDDLIAEMESVNEVSIVIDRQQASTPFDSPVSILSQMNSPNSTYCEASIETSPHRLAVMSIAEYQNESISSRSKRKQVHPHRSIKQLASLAEKIINGIIVIEPRMAWEDYHRTSTNNSKGIHNGYLDVPATKRSRSATPSKGRKEAKTVILRSPVSETSRSPSPDRAVSPSPSNNPNSKPNSIIGKHIEDDFEPTKLADRVDLYLNIYKKRKSPGSLALLGTNRLSGFGGTPLDISAAPGASLLDDSEFELCSLLRLQPLQYFQSRDTLLNNLKERGYYKKSAAQKMLHIDVNKTGRLYDFFVKMGWIPETEEGLHQGNYSDPPCVDWSRLLP